MIGLTTPVLWYLSRASGIVSLLLFTVVMALGVLTATRVGGRTLPRFVVTELHRRVALFAVVFLGIHVASTVLDSYVNISIFAVVIPGVSHYRAFDVALGALAIDCLFAVVLTSLGRKHLSRASWRTVHWISYLSWPIALLHALLIGTDTPYLWMEILLGTCVAVVVAAVLWRLWPQTPARRSMVVDPRESLVTARSPESTSP